MVMSVMKMKVRNTHKAARRLGLWVGGRAEVLRQPASETGVGSDADSRRIFSPSTPDRGWNIMECDDDCILV